MAFHSSALSSPSVSSSPRLNLSYRAFFSRSVRVGLVVRNEALGASITYWLIVQSRGKYLSGGSRQGSTATGRAAFALRITPPRTARVVQVSVRALIHSATRAQPAVP